AICRASGCSPPIPSRPIILSVFAIRPHRRVEPLRFIDDWYNDPSPRDSSSRRGPRFWGIPLAVAAGRSGPCAPHGRQRSSAGATGGWAFRHGRRLLGMRDPGRKAWILAGAVLLGLGGLMAAVRVRGHSDPNELATGVRLALNNRQWSRAEDLLARLARQR